jgi:hypothetical protein
MLEIVTGTIGTVLLEFGAVSVERAAVAACANPVHDEPGGQLEVANGGDDGG